MTPAELTEQLSQVAGVTVSETADGLQVPASALEQFSRLLEHYSEM